MRKWLSDMLADPDGSPSSTRIAGILLVLAGIGVAAAGMALGREQASTVTALVGGGGFAFLTRKKSGAAAE